MNTAQQILSDNTRQHNGYAYTVPTKGLYPFQWLWDSGFTALGFATYDEPRAWQELESLLLGQWADGMLPHIVFHQTDPGYFPNIDTWATEKVSRLAPNAPHSSGITQPPVLGFVMRHLLENAIDTTLAENKVKALLPKVLEFHRFLHTHRDPHANGLTAIVHPWEAGTDNSPQWDEALARVVVSDLPPYTRRDTSHVDSAQRPQKADYDRYLSLLMGYRAVGYQPDLVYQTSQFKVANIMFNAILLRSDKDLLWLCQRFGLETSQLEAWIATGEAGIQHLWNEQAGAFWSYDIVADKQIPVTTSSSLMPLFAGAATPQQAVRLVGILETWATKVRYLVPSTDPFSSAYEPKRYWRGPVWAVVNWMIAAGLDQYGYADWATRVREDTKALLGQGYAEYWNPESGEGLGGFHFTWTAAIGLLL
jgi:Trehalase